MPSFALTPIANLSGSGSPNYLSGGYAADTITVSSTLYAVVASYEDDAIVVIDISDPHNPSKVGHLQGAGAPNYLDGVCGVKCAEISGTPYAFAVSNIDNGLVVIDLSTPATPALVTAVTGAGNPNYLDGAIGIDLMEISSNWYALITAKDDDCFSIYDVNTPATPTRTGGLSGAGAPNYLDGAHGVKGVTISGTEYALVTGFFDDSFIVIDISTPAAPSLSDTLTGAGTPNYLNGAHSIDVKQISSVWYAFVSGYYDDSLVAINITDPADISLADAISGEASPEYIGEPCNVGIVQMASGDYYALIAGYVTDAIITINVTDPTNMLFVSVTTGGGYPNHLGGIHGFAIYGYNLFAMGYNEDSFVVHELSEDGSYISMTSTATAGSSVTFELREAVTVSMVSSAQAISAVTLNLGLTEPDFSSQIGQPVFYPIRKVVMLDSDNAQHDISDYVKAYDRVLWQIEQDTKPNVFTANNTTIYLRNDDFEFDTDYASNYFITVLGRQQDGYLTPVIIKGGYYIDGAECLIDIFKGVITNIKVSTADNIALIDLQCVSRILRDTKCVNTGDQWTTQRLYGGYTIAYLDAPISEDDTNIPASDGGFSADFPPSGYIQIEDEIIYYGAMTDTHFVYCMRGRHNTSPASHDRAVGDTGERRKIFLTLDDGSDTDSRYFQFPLYPISQKSVANVTTSDGVVTVLDDRDIYLSIPEASKKLIAYVDYERGWLEFGGAPTDPSSVVATFKNVPHTIGYAQLAKTLLDNQGFDTSEIQDITLYDRMGNKVPYIYGRIKHAHYGGSQVSLANLRCQALARDDNYVYLAIGHYIIRWNDAQFEVVADLGSDYEIVKLGVDTNDNIYGIARPAYEEAADALEKGWVFCYDGSGVTFQTGQVAAYFPTRGRNIPLEAITSIPPDAGIQGAQWRNFSVDSDNACCWFLYNNGVTMGLGKVTFGGLVTYYPCSVEDDANMDFADSGDYIEFFYQTVTGGREYIWYDRLHKDSGTWAYIGSLKDRVYVSYRELTPMDAVYNSNDDKIYLNIIDANMEGDLWRGSNGWFYSFDKASATVTELLEYDDDYAHITKMSGGVYSDGYVYYVRGSELSIGQEIDDETPIDSATGHLWRIDNNVMADIGALAYRETSKTVHFIRESVKGISSPLVAQSDGTLFYVSCDATTRNTQRGYSFGRYSEHFNPVVRVADINDMSIWDVLSELATISGYELGVSRYGKVFLRPRVPDVTILTAGINDAVDVIPSGDTSAFPASGIIQIEQEVITYTGKTASSFTGCVRGDYDSTAIAHIANMTIWKIDHVIMNKDHDDRSRLASKEPNYLDIYNYIEVPFGDYRLIFDYQRAGEAWADSSEYKYGRKPLTIGNSFLTEDDYVVADAIGFRYYDQYAKRKGLIEAETVWQPQIDLGDVFTIYQPHRALMTYLITRIRRAEYWITDVKVSLFGRYKPAGYRRTIYDLEYS